MFSCVCKFKLSIFYFSQSVILPTSPSKLCCCVLFLLKLIFMYLYLCLIYSTRRDLGKNQRQTCLSLLLCWPESISVLHEILLNALIGVLLSFTSSKSLQFKERKEMGSFSFLNHCMCVCGGGHFCAMLLCGCQRQFLSSLWWVMISNSDCRNWWKAPLPAELSHQHICYSNVTYMVRWRLATD